MCYRCRWPFVALATCVLAFIPPQSIVSATCDPPSCRWGCLVETYPVRVAVESISWFVLPLIETSSVPLSLGPDISSGPNSSCICSAVASSCLLSYERNAFSPHSSALMLFAIVARLGGVFRCKVTEAAAIGGRSVVASFVIPAVIRSFPFQPSHTHSGQSLFTYQGL